MCVARVARMRGGIAAGEAAKCVGCRCQVSLARRCTIGLEMLSAEQALLSPALRRCALQLSSELVCLSKWCILRVEMPGVLDPLVCAEQALSPQFATLTEEDTAATQRRAALLCVSAGLLAVC